MREGEEGEDREGRACESDGDAELPYSFSSLKQQSSSPCTPS